MGSCPCFGGRKNGRSSRTAKLGDQTSTTRGKSSGVKSNRTMDSSVPKDDDCARSNTVIFSYRELATATDNFRRESMIGEGGFGAVYQGQFARTGQVVAVKQLNHSGVQGNREFLVEVLMLSLLRHPNLVSMIGYCAEGEQRLLVYEFMPLGSLEDYLHDMKEDMKPLDWNTRMKIAAGAARGLSFLHNESNPPVIYRDLKSSNVLLGEEFHPKLSDFGLAKFGPEGDKSYVSTRIMGTHGYCAPEYAETGKLTMKSDVYSFGVVLLELITGQQALDKTRGKENEQLVDWACPMLREQRRFVKVADPKLRGEFPVSSLCRAVEVALMCLRRNPVTRPTMIEVVRALDYLASQQYDPINGAAESDDAVIGDASPYSFYHYSQVEEDGQLVKSNEATAKNHVPLTTTKDATSPKANIWLSNKDDPTVREHAVEEAKWGKSCRGQKLDR